MCQSVLCVHVSHREMGSGWGGAVEICLCAVLWDLSICVTVIINRLALRKPSEMRNRSTKLDYSGLYIFWSFVSLFLSLSLLAIFTELLHPQPKKPKPPNACMQSHTWTPPKNNVRQTSGYIQIMLTPSTSVCQLQSRSIFVLFSSVVLFTAQCLSPSLHGCTSSPRLTGNEHCPWSLVPHTSNKGLKAQKGVLIKYGWS